MSEAAMDVGLWHYRASPTRIIDGDTLELRIDMGFKMSIDTSVRVLGVDTPERRKAVMEGYYAAKKFVDDWMQDALSMALELDPEWPLRIVSHKPDSFGRWLAEVYNLEGKSLAASIIQEGLGVPYSR